MFIYLRPGRVWCVHDRHVSRPVYVYLFTDARPMDRAGHPLLKDGKLLISQVASLIPVSVHRYTLPHLKCHVNTVTVAEIQDWA